MHGHGKKRWRVIQDSDDEAPPSSQETLVGDALEERLAWWESEVEKVAFVCQAWLHLTDGSKYFLPIHDEILVLAFEVATCLSEHDAMKTGAIPPESTLTMAQLAKSSEVIVRRYHAMKKMHGHILQHAREKPDGQTSSSSTAIVLSGLSQQGDTQIVVDADEEEAPEQEAPEEEAPEEESGDETTDDESLNPLQ